MKKLLTIATFAIAILALPLVSNADGMIIDPYINDYVIEDGQQAVINLEGGMQKMAIAISPDTSENETLWLFPIPASPEKTTMDIAQHFPTLYGTEVESEAEYALDNMRLALISTQLYPLLFSSLYTTAPAPMEDTGMKEAAEPEAMGLGGSVEVHETLSKEGITAELVTASDGQALVKYFKKKDLDVDKSMIEVLDQYIGEDDSFVAAWLDPVSSSSTTNDDGTVIPYTPYNDNYKGLLINFPAEEIFYPMIPTSVYDSETIPITVKVIGDYQPRLWSEVESYTETTYYTDGYLETNPQLEKLISNTEDLYHDYTKVEFSAPSKLFTQDLTFDEGVPAKTHFARFIAKHQFWMTVILLVGISILSCWLAALIIFREVRTRGGRRKFTLFGLWNLLTIIAVAIALIFKHTKEPTEDQKRTIEELKAKGLSTRGIRPKDPRKWGFIVMFTIIFVVLSFAVPAILKLFI